MIVETLSTKEEFLQQAIDRFWETIPPLWNRVRSNLRTTAVERFGISVEQFHILRHINHGINSVSDLAEERCISRPAISQVVDVLAQKGLLTRQQETDDRRHVKLALTEKGKTLLNAIFDNNHRWMISKLEALSQDELGVAIQAMETLKKTFEGFLE
jgi:DNA-binding MarR family transcriptional regulator